MDVGDVGEPGTKLLAQRQRGLDRGVAAASTRIGLDAHADAHEVPTAAEVLERLVGDVEAAAECLEISGGALERGGLRGEAAAGQERGHHAIARRVSRM